MILLERKNTLAYFGHCSRSYFFLNENFDQIFLTFANKNCQIFEIYDISKILLDIVGSNKLRMLATNSNKFTVMNEEPAY